MQPLPLRPNVCLLILNREGRLFLGQRYQEPGIWQLPQGGAEEGSSLEENAIREAHEELGVERHLLKVIKRLRATHQYEFAHPPAYARNRWRGQDQTFFLIEFSGTDVDLNLSRFEPEFESFRWCNTAEVRALAEPRRRPGYEAALKEVEEYLATQCPKK